MNSSSLTGIPCVVCLQSHLLPSSSPTLVHPTPTLVLHSKAHSKAFIFNLLYCSWLVFPSEHYIFNIYALFLCMLLWLPPICLPFLPLWDIEVGSRLFFTIYTQLIYMSLCACCCFFALGLGAAFNDQGKVSQKIIIDNGPIHCIQEGLDESYFLLFF